MNSVLIGGYALLAHNVQRLTFDIDFMIIDSEFERIEKQILDLGYSVRNRQDAFIQLKSGKAGIRDIDFLLCDSETMEILLSEAVEVEISGVVFKVASPTHMIEMKLHAIANNPGRELKDKSDIIELMRLNAIDPRQNRILAIFEKYSLLQLYETVIAEIEKRRRNE